MEDDFTLKEMIIELRKDVKQLQKDVTSLMANNGTAKWFITLGVSGVTAIFITVLFHILKI